MLSFSLFSPLDTHSHTRAHTCSSAHGPCVDKPETHAAEPREEEAAVFRSLWGNSHSTSIIHCRCKSISCTSTHEKHLWTKMGPWQMWTYTLHKRHIVSVYEKTLQYATLTPTMPNKLLFSLWVGLDNPFVRFGDYQEQPIWKAGENSVIVRRLVEAETKLVHAKSLSHMISISLAHT